MNNRVVYVLSWLVAVVVATAVGLAAVSTVGDVVRGRGPLGSEVQHADAAAERSGQRSSPDPDAQVVTRNITGDFGVFVVSCQGVYASGVDARANQGDGWRVVRFEPGPDDDVEAVFTSARTLVDMEVFCNGGKPTVAETERSHLPDDD